MTSNYWNRKQYFFIVKIPPGTENFEHISTKTLFSFAEGAGYSDGI
jgi:hypothetical protein